MVQTVAIIIVLSLTLPFWDQPIPVLLIALMLFHACANLILPHWRAWMGQLVPDKIRGRFFSRRTRIAMMTSFLTFILGGLLLSGSEHIGHTWIGFFILFTLASVGRGMSTTLLSKMHDDATLPTHGDRRSLRKMVAHLFSLLADRDFRRFSLFIAGMQCFVALSGPFFAVYMLRDLNFTYFQFALNTGTSIFTQFLMLPVWGKVCDRKGNRYVMAVCGSLVPILPVLWLFSDFYGYLMCVQVVAGISWSGYTLATSNYLYDQKPRDLHFASYAAISAAMVALAVFVGALAGGYIIDWIPQSISLSGLSIHIARPIVVIFILSTILRIAVALWYLPRAPELRLKQRGRVRDLVIRVASFTPISGVMIDVVNKRRRKTD